MQFAELEIITQAGMAQNHGTRNCTKSEACMGTR